MEDELFQCHTYLIEAGEESVLIDPGSKVTFPETLRKIRQIIPFSHIKYFVVHHQDPDITGALETIDSMIEREDAVVLSHWRAITLLKHLDLKIRFQCVEELKWTLKSDSLDLTFIFTPYLHFPGAFCTLDNSTGSLFSSDIFGAFSKDFSLFVEDESYLETLRLFHEHYMPSREILAYAMTQFEKYPLKRILPQHGSIIPGCFIPFFLEQLKHLDCGLYLLSKDDTDLEKLSRLNRFLNNFLETLISYSNFDTVVYQLHEHIQSIIPSKSISFLFQDSQKDWCIMKETGRYKRTKLPKNSHLHQVLAVIEKSPARIFQEEGNRLILPLENSDSLKIIAYSVIELSEELKPDRERESVLLQLSHPLSIAVEREIIQQTLDREKQRFYEMSIRDSLTGFYNRAYMNETMPRIFSHQDRGIVQVIALLQFDLDHFKSVNDQFGHPAGDEVLKKTTACIDGILRNGDIAVRIGGEEFAVFLILEEQIHAETIGERIREGISKIDFSHIMGDSNQTISGGLVFRKKDEKLDSLIGRADYCLYEAKNGGRNRIVKG